MAKNQGSKIVLACKVFLLYFRAVNENIKMEAKKQKPKVLVNFRLRRELIDDMRAAALRTGVTFTRFAAEAISEKVTGTKNQRRHF